MKPLCGFTFFPYFCVVKNLEHITAPIKADLERFEAFFEHTLRVDTTPMDTIMRYVLETRGKRLRPMLVLFSAKLFGEVNENTLRAATFVEMMHSATLLHDDVVDDSDQRRGQASVKACFGNRSAVLAGDYLLAKAMLLFDDSNMLHEMLQTAAAMSEGELMQNTIGLSYHGNRFNENPQMRLPQCDSPTKRYLDIITRKTAMLMRSCCAVGAMSVKASQKQVQQVSDFGLSFGQLFQLRDDILDADDTENLSLAQELLPKYLQKTLDSLQILPESEIRNALQELTLFCAEREL